MIFVMIVCCCGWKQMTLPLNPRRLSCGNSKELDHFMKPEVVISFSILPLLLPRLTFAKNSFQSSCYQNSRHRCSYREPHGILLVTITLSIIFLRFWWFIVWLLLVHHDLRCKDLHLLVETSWVVFSGDIENRPYRALDPFYSWISNY